MTDLILSLDQGTSSSRAMVFDQHANVIASAQQDFPQYYPQNGWVEHNPLEIWQSQRACIEHVLKHELVDKTTIRALGIANQRETTIIWDRQTGQPIAPAIVWQDRRTAPLCAQLSERNLESTFIERTGLRLDPYFSGTKIRWLLDNIPDARARAERGELAFGTVDSWLIWQLTGGNTHVTDISNASRTLCMNLKTGNWDTELLEHLEIPLSLFPTIVPSSGRIAHTTSDIIGHKIAISGIAGDQQAATFGQACYQPGMAKNTYGTGCFLLMNTGAEAQTSQHGLLSTAGWQTPEGQQYMLEGSVFMGGATIQWLRDGLGIITSAAEVEKLAQQVEDCGDVYFVPAMTGLGAPYWDTAARGCITGLTRASSKAHIARAALEGIALQTYDLIDAMHQDIGAPIRELRVDGGAANNDLLMQIQADILGTDVVRPKITETTALGAAYLAGLAERVWGSMSDISMLWQVDKVFTPQQNEDWRHQKIAAWHAAIRRTLTI